jgi:hypothetical protein
VPGHSGWRPPRGSPTPPCWLARALAVFLVVEIALALAAEAGAWRRVLRDRFSHSGAPPVHWHLYDGPYGSGAQNCARPSHDYVSRGKLHLLMKYESSGNCGPSWYTGGMMLAKRFRSIDQRITLRWRVVNRKVRSHRNIPMRWPSPDNWPVGGEEDFCESTGTAGCSTFLHYGAGNDQIEHRYTVDLTRWHRWRLVRRSHVVRVYRDDRSVPVWIYHGSRKTLPDHPKRIVLQQECDFGGCPSGTAGREDIQIDWIRVDNF